MTSFDAIVIGGGHNGLVAAALLAKSGWNVVVTEAAEDIGGAARTENFAPGFRVSSVAHILNRLHPEMVKALDLQRHGLETVSGGGAPSTAITKDGAPLTMRGAYGQALDGATAEQAAAWAGLRALLFRQAEILKPFLSKKPPVPGDMSLSEMSGLGMAALSLKRLGKEDMRDFLRMFLMNVTDVLDENIEDERLRGLLAFDAVLGSHLGPRSPTSLLGLYWRLAGELGGTSGAQLLPIGGMSAVTGAIERAARAAGVTIRTGMSVGRILVENGAAAGIEFSSGEEIRAGTVVSAINPRTTLVDLVGPRFLDTGLVRKLLNVRMKGDAAKLNLALDRVPELPGLDKAAKRGRLLIAPSDGHVERAFNPAKYGAFSPEPVLEFTLPSLVDPSLAPAGACVLSAVVQYAPYALKGGWEAGKPSLLAAIMAQLEAHMPGIGKSVQHAELLTPVDIEQRYRMPGGHWHHGELQADQMLMSRPVAGWSGYDTPIAGLWLAGAGSHPGGGVSGAPALNAVRAILAAKG
jgi:phytoene dehydrogenase-like protein